MPAPRTRSAHRRRGRGAAVPEPRPPPWRGCRHGRRAPGPSTSAFKRVSCRMACSPSGPSHPRSMTAVRCAALTPSASGGEATVTRPEPIRSAARAASRAAPVRVAPPEATRVWPRSYLCDESPGLRQSPQPECRVVGKQVSALGRQNLPADADIRHLDLAAMRPPRHQQVAGLSRREGHGAGGLDGNAPHRSRIAVDAGGKIDGENRQARSVHPVDDVPRRAVEIAGEAGAEERIDDQVGVGERCLFEQPRPVRPSPARLPRHRPSERSRLPRRHRDTR